MAELTLQRLEAVRDEEDGKPVQADAPPAVTSGRWSLLLTGEGETFDRDRDAADQERGSEGDTWRLQIGADYKLSARAVVGALLGYEQSDSDFDADQAGANFTPAANEGGQETDTFSITLYGSLNLTDRLYVDAAGGVGITDYEFQRTPIFQESTRVTPQTLDVTNGDSDGHEYTATVGLGYDFSRGPWSFGPYLRGRYTHTEIDSYRESDNGTGLALNVSIEDDTSLASTVGARTSYVMGFSWGVLVPHLRAEYEHEFDNDRLSVTTSFVQDPANNQLTREGDTPDQNYFNVGGGLQFILPNGWMPYVDAESLLGYEDLNRFRLTFGLRKEL